MIEACDCAVFNLSAFRGTGVDDGTAFELGYATALKKPCFGYVNDPLSLRQRIAEIGPVIFDSGAQRWHAIDGYCVEDFGNAHNLMIENAIQEGGNPTIRASETRAMGDLTAFIACLDQMLAHYNAHPSV